MKIQQKPPRTGEDRENYWQDVLKNASDFDPKLWAKLPFVKSGFKKSKILRACKDKKYWTLWQTLKSLTDGDREKIQKDIFKEMNSCSYDLGQDDHIPGLLYDYNLITQKLKNDFLQIACRTENIPYIRRALEMGAETDVLGGYYDAEYYVRTKKLVTIDFLLEQDVLTDTMKIEMVAKAKENYLDHVARQIEDTLPDKYKAQKAVKTDQEWQKNDNDSITRTRVLSDDLVCQEVFNFAARHVKAITRSKDGASPLLHVETRRFDDYADPDYIERVKDEFEKRGGVVPKPTHQNPIDLSRLSGTRIGKAHL